MAENKRQRGALARVVGRFRMAAAARAFASWWNGVLQARGTRRILSKLLKRGLSMALDAWAAAIQTLRAQRAVVARTLGKLLHRSTGAAFEAWVEALAELKAGRKRGLAVIARIRFAAAARALMAWRGCRQNSGCRRL